jgi:hypothetical protein
MNAQAFIDAVRTMVGLPPEMSARLVELAPLMTDEERLDTLRQLTPIHTDIVQTGKAIVEDAEKGMQEIETMERGMKAEQRNAAEAGDKTNPERMLDDSASTPAA